MRFADHGDGRHGQANGEGAAVKLAIMQPYLFPYIGYFQLLAAVDRFVFYDDINYIKNGWVNRNRLFLAGAVRYMTVPLAGASSFQTIDVVAPEPGEHWKKKLLESVRHGYAKAPHYRLAHEMLASVIHGDHSSIGALASASVRIVCEYVGLDTELVDSSRQYGNAQLAGEARVIDICLRERASRYLNAPGGAGLYDKAHFAEHGIALEFIVPRLAPYPQLGPAFQPGLSILDVLMFNDARAARELIAAGVVT